MKHIYQISILGDNFLEGKIALEREELDTFYKILDALRPDGPYVPQIIVRDLTREAQEFELARLREEFEEWKRQEQFREECSHLGKFSIADKLAAAMAEAGWNFDN